MIWYFMPSNVCRYLAKDKKNGMHQLAKKLMRRLGVMGKTEDFDSEQLKSKMIFFTVQGVYSVLVCIPTKWLYSSYHLSVLYISFIYLWCIWRGGTYYIEVSPSKNCQNSFPSLISLL